MNDGPKILIRGAGELASATAHHLHQQGFSRILMLEKRFPKAIRRKVCFSEAVYDGAVRIQNVLARSADELEQVEMIQRLGDVAVGVFELEEAIEIYQPDIFIEAAMLHSNWGLTSNLALIVIALGSGYTAGVDCDAVVSTSRGPDVGAVHGESGESVADEPPAAIMGYRAERATKAARDGIFFAVRTIGSEVERGERIGTVVSVYGVEDFRRGVPVDSSYAVTARITGVLRGLLRDGTPVNKGDKLADIDPRGKTRDLDHISDKAHRVAEGVHEAILENIEKLEAKV